jgi:hypothetical protein
MKRKKQEAFKCSWLVWVVLVKQADKMWVVGCPGGMLVLTNAIPCFVGFEQKMKHFGYCQTPKWALPIWKKQRHLPKKPYSTR